MFKIRFVFCLAIALTLSHLVLAQNIRLRANVNPSTLNSTQRYADVFGDGNLAVIGTFAERGAFIYDVSNPDAPVLKSWYNPGNNQQFLEAIVVGNRGYFGSGNGGGGVHIVDLSNPSNPVLMGTVDPTHGNGHSLIHEMVVFRQNNQDYLIENFNGFSNKIIKVINVSNPANPLFVRNIDPQEVNWVHAMHIRGNRLFTSGWGNSLNAAKTEIYDISNIETTAPTLLGIVPAGNNSHSNWTSEDGNYMYNCREYTVDSPTGPNGDLRGELRVYDIHIPNSPVLVKSVTMTELGINASTPHNPVVKGNFLYVAWYQAGLQVFDISNPANPKRVGQYDTYAPQFVEEKTTLTDKQKLLQTEPWDVICGLSAANGSLPTGFAGMWAVYPFLGEDRVLVGDLASGLFVLDVTKITNPSAAPARNYVSDFDGDGKTDYSYFTNSTGDWTVQNSSNSATSATHFGQNGDKIVPNDYDGDGKTDLAIFRAGTWHIFGTATGYRVQQFGFASDIPLSGDFDADGKADIAVFRPSTGVWYVQQSALGFYAVQWGLNGDLPIVGDYEGDGKADLTIFRPSSGLWYILPSSSSIPIIVAFGLSGDKPILANFDDDSKTDIAVYRPSTGVWYALKSKDNSFFAIPFGLPTDVPTPADYDGDGKTDISVFRPSENNWYRLNSSNWGFVLKTFGGTGVTAVPSSVNP